MNTNNSDETETGPVYRLEDLLAQVTEDNLHGEISTGGPVGQEEW